MADIQRVAFSTDAEVLTEGLGHVNEAVRFWGAYGLGNQPGNVDYQQSLNALADLLDDPVPVVRLVAGRAICKMGDPELALETVTRELKNEDEWVRLYAALVLDELGETSRPVSGDLQSVMEDENKYVVRVANHALNHLFGTQNVVR
jgi:uncharacterized sulfatase